MNLSFCRIIIPVALSVIVAQAWGISAVGGKETDLPEVMVESNRNKIVHILAYIREYSTMSTYQDTVTLFREKLVDYMLVPNQKIRFKGWTQPRILTSKSYYRFSDSNGLDSVSDESSFHFSWGDWVGLPPLKKLTDRLSDAECGVDTIYGKYSPCVTWKKSEDVVNIDVNVLADFKGRQWCPSFSGYFKDEVDFYDFRLSFKYENVLGIDISPLDLTRFSYIIESKGRGHEMQRIYSDSEQYYFTTKGDAYIIDREYISSKEARKWESYDYSGEEVELFEPTEATPLDPFTLALVDRVGAIDKTQVRVSLPPDERLGCGKLRNDNFNLGKRALFMLKQLTGITLLKSRKNAKTKWSEFKEKKIRELKEQFKEEQRRR